MPIVDNKTPNRNYLLPNTANLFPDDILRLITQAGSIDADIGTLFATMSGKVDTATLSNYIAVSQKNIPNGVAGLNSSGQFDIAQLPPGVVGGMRFQTVWNAATNIPVIPAASAANKDFYWIVSADGSTNIGGITDWKSGDWLVSTGTGFGKIDNTDGVQSVAGRQGAVILTKTDVGLANVDNTSDATKQAATIAAGLAANNTSGGNNTHQGTETFNRPLLFGELYLVVTAGTAAWDISLGGPNVSITMPASALVVANPTNFPGVDYVGYFRIYNNSGATRAISWGSAYTPLGGGVLPTSIANGEQIVLRFRTFGSGTYVYFLARDSMYAQQIQLYAAIAATGTSFDFTGIPSWAKEIDVMFDNVSTNGVSPVQVQIGPAGGIETTGYVSTSVSPTFSQQTSTTGFVWDGTAATATRVGKMTLTLEFTNRWVETHVGQNDPSRINYGTGTKSVANTLSILRLTTVNGTDIFDVGAVSILVKG